MNLLEVFDNENTTFYGIGNIEFRLKVIKQVS